MKLKIYGSKGSMAFFGRKNIEYGGNTVCTALDIDGHIMIINLKTRSFSLDSPIRISTLLTRQY